MRLVLIAVLFCALICGAVVSTLLAVTPAPAPQPEPPPDAPAKLPPPPPAEVLARIQPPAAKPVIKTRQEFSIEVDRSKQILAVNVPKKDLWISPQVEAYQTVEVVTEGAPLQQTTTVLARLKKGRILYTTAQNQDWVQLQIVENGEVLRGWVQKKNLKPVAEDRPLHKSLNQGGQYASAAMLVQKGKQFDDGLYAAVELAMQNGLGPTTGKKDWLPRLAAAVKADAGGTPLATIFAATELSGNSPPVPPAIAKLKSDALTKFLADEKRSKPIGFYTWSKPLEAIFRQDRMLQSSVLAKHNAASITAIGQALAADASARESYEKTMRLNERLTNKLKGPGYRNVLAAIDAGKTPEFDPNEQISLLPPSRSHETDLIMRLYGDRPIPAGFDLMNEVITRLKNGQLSFQPQADSGWYDHQLWSLESLVRFDKSLEASRLRPNDLYHKHLENLFKGTYALMRETHIKQLDHPAPASAAPPPMIEREKVYITPDPHVELLPTMYLRRAASYRFARSVLIEIFGQENVAKMFRQTANGPVETNLLEELDQLAGLFGGAYITACREIGMPAEAAAEIGNGKTADEQAVGFLRWLAALRSDPDLAPDVRMMAPVFFDQQRGKNKVWLMLGWEEASSTISYAQTPTVTVTDRDGKPVAADTGPEIHFGSNYCSLATPAFAEVYVTKILNRAEFRRHCDTYQTKAAILANLE
ncbi:hypothetical protein [Anatilimnocola floriformis]|uniref:hypothetical protein n=1 Tax=Anatilimnocola floriformis TaxID=2948575 RepID=UPI0020C31FBF|nr:hypothetical protein [Anatilimnocola floriformis]